MTFILDNDISFRIAEALRALGPDVRALRKHFPQETPDTELLAELGTKGWHLVTADRQILKRPHEAAALHKARVTTFFLGPFFETLQFWDQAVWLVKNWPRFESMAQNMDRGTCVIIKHSGKMYPLVP